MCSQWFQFLTYEDLYYYLLLLRNIVFDLALQAIKLIAATFIAKSSMILLAGFIERGKRCGWIGYRNVDSCIHSHWWLIDWVHTIKLLLILSNNLSLNIDLYTYFSKTIYFSFKFVKVGHYHLQENSAFVKMMWKEKCEDVLDL